jgi:hypothetical protein
MRPVQYILDAGGHPSSTKDNFQPGSHLPVIEVPLVNTALSVGQILIVRAVCRRRVSRSTSLATPSRTATAASPTAANPAWSIVSQSLGYRVYQVFVPTITKGKR